MAKQAKKASNTGKRFDASEEQKFLVDGFNRLSETGKMTLLDILCAFLHNQRAGLEQRDITQ
ncbi:hypothetical protein EPN18_06405 [bacterium]|nr:MAG: hypothetical protein EPN18_06405 [bacterium]